MRTLQEELYNLLTKGDTSAVLAMLQSIFSTQNDMKSLQEVVLLTGQLNQINTQERLGTIESREVRVVKNQINMAVSDLISRVPYDATLHNDVPPLPPVDQNKSSQVNQPEAGRLSKIPLGIGVFLILLTAFFVYKFPCPSATIAWWIRVTAASSIAALTYYLGGTIEASLSQGIKGAGSLVLLVILYLLNPVGGILGQDCILEVPVTVFVQDGKGDLALRQKGHVMMDYGGERKRKEIGEQGEAFFTNLKVGEKVRLSIDFSEPYKPIRPDSIYTIDKTGKIYLAVALQNLDHVFGRVFFRNQPLAGVVVDIGSELRDTTDSLGYYDLHIPAKYQRKEQEVTFYKNGYKMLFKRAYPQTNEPLNVLMEK